MTSIPTSFRCCLIVWVATSPMCATNFSLRLSAAVHPLQGHRFVATYWRSMWKARCMAVATASVEETAASSDIPRAGRDRNAASPSTSIRSNSGAASITRSSSLAVLTSACARLMRCVLM